MPLQGLKLSVIVIVHNMPAQAMNTLYSLSPHYQKDVPECDYEVIVTENNSTNTLSPTAVVALGKNFQYQLREEPGVSPAAAINESLARCSGMYIGLLIDGARMLTPGVLKYTLQALNTSGAVVAVPGYYLTEQGKTEHGTESISSSKILAYERNLLEDNCWQNDGYRLFSQACFSNGNRHGFMEPIMECNALFCERSLVKNIGGAEKRFNLRGGGALNLHMFRQIATVDDTHLVVLPGEGNFHQFHGGTSTTPGEDRDTLVKSFKAQLDEFWPGGFKGVRREPMLYGPVGQHALPFLQASAKSAAGRLARFERDKRNPWEDE